MPQKTVFDVTVTVGLVLAFSLPLTLLIPDFSIWDLVPKIRVLRYHALSRIQSWGQINATIIFFLLTFFCLFLEIKRRTLDDLVESVLTVSQATDKTMETERERQATTVRMCVELLDTSADHYEHLVLFREEMRKRKQRPPSIDSSIISMTTHPDTKSSRHYIYPNDLNKGVVIAEMTTTWSVCSDCGDTAGRDLQRVYCRGKLAEHSTCGATCPPRINFSSQAPYPGIMNTISLEKNATKPRDVAPLD